MAIKFQTPFLYDPTKGNLLLDVDNLSGATSNVGADFFDAVNNTGDQGLPRFWGGGGARPRLSGTPDTLGLIAQFQFAAPSPRLPPSPSPPPWPCSPPRRRLLVLGRLATVEEAGHGVGRTNTTRPFVSGPLVATLHAAGLFPSLVRHAVRPTQRMWVEVGGFLLRA